ncbi:hypothetical protein FHS95_003161 [Sphingomonas naasensis]|uniref:Uncharacterized protein n=1 Tax=Sphingomonas naasensis TaxID=1344951 RepID=A0A4S1WH46_9SPHN|nr:hypothetical protein [Sphingomonas naasensis]NIJ21458.1 hypothetical protein [Sphingomonas naasensis]TGX41585.1 hypothetical protein E5A74_13305 [Sphingomonas naasensis]
MPLLLAGLLTLASPIPFSPLGTEARAAPGALRFWNPREGRAAWTSDGVRIEIAPAPCEAPPQTEGCRFDPQNNQAELTVTAPGVAPFRVRSDDQSSYYRVAVVRFDRRDPRPGVVIVNESGGSGGDVRVQLLVPSHDGYREAWLPGQLQGELGATLADLSGDGAVDFVLRDGAFDSAFGCNGCTPRPPVVLTLRAGVPTDVSREPAFAGLYRKDMAARRSVCISQKPDRNGACAAWIADAARIGAFDAAWEEMLRHYDRKGALWQGCAVTVYPCPPGHGSAYRSFPESLRAFLRRTGYID